MKNIKQNKQEPRLQFQPEQQPCIVAIMSMKKVIDVALIAAIRESKQLRNILTRALLKNIEMAEVCAHPQAFFEINAENY